MKNILSVLTFLFVSSVSAECSQSNVYALFHNATEACGVPGQGCSETCSKEIIAACAAGQKCEDMVLRAGFCALCKSYTGVHQCEIDAETKCEIKKDGDCDGGAILSLYKNATQTCGADATSYCSAACANSVKVATAAGQSCADDVLGKVMKSSFCYTTKMFDSTALNIHKCEGWVQSDCDKGTGCRQVDAVATFHEATKACGTSKETYCSEDCASKYQIACDLGQSCTSWALRATNLATAKAYEATAWNIYKCDTFPSCEMGSPAGHTVPGLLGIAILIAATWL